MDRSGIVLANTAVTSSTTDEYPVVLSNDAAGGVHHVSTTSEMESIFAPRRRLGMFCYVANEGALYQLVGGLADHNWTKLPPNVVYMHQQNTPSDTWTINHNLHIYPEIEAKVNDVWAHPTVTHTNDIQAVLTFAFPTIGIAQLK
jgi:hypothetical protein